ncbi:helix-turn-helix domain-containing protein [Dysosmobacter welbionis]|uniref:helix-turn-helix domain-containing protein n=1 Tax=Dysosmobacter welbionis TaxID=2093857 RepID=UPI002943599A|nr:helix-turn-helix domain-containing protein [Dysosmobacter welbionis]
MESKELHTSFAQVLQIEELKSLPLVLRIPDLMRVLGIGRNSAYDLVHSNQIRVIRVGRQIRIPRDEVIHFLSRAT